MASLKPFLYLTAALLFVGTQTGLAADVSPSTTSTQPSAQPDAVGACCTGTRCQNGLTASSCLQQKGDWLSGTKCAASTCARGICCRMTTRAPSVYCTNDDKTNCLKSQCLAGNQLQPNGTVAVVFLEGVKNTTSCNRLKGACCIRQASGRRVCKRLGFDECRVLDGFLKFSYNTSCTQAKCSSASIGGCCLVPDDGVTPVDTPQQCLLERTREECTFWTNQDFAPTQACQKAQPNPGSTLSGGTTCANFTGACCYINSAGSSTCDDTLTQGQCRATAGFVAFDYTKKCSQTNCAKFGACCNMDALARNKQPTCSPGRTQANCRRTAANSVIWVGGAPCSACRAPLLGACCTGSTNGTTTCESGVDYKICIAKPAYLAFNIGKDCQVDGVNCNMYGACCVPQDQQSTQFICVGDTYTPHITQADCATRSFIEGPNAPKSLWRSGVPCPSFTQCPAAP